MILFERSSVRLNSRLPQLKLSWKSWLSRHLWIVVLLLAVLSTVLFLGSFALLVYLRYAIEGILFLTHIPLGWIYVGELIANTVLTVVIIVLLFTAIGPLRRLSYRGWKRLYTAVMVNVVANVALPFITGIPGMILIRNNHLIDVGTLVVNGLLAVASLYVVLQVRSFFKS